VALTPYYFTMIQGGGSTVRASMNDVPFYSRTLKDQAGVTSPAVHLLEPGENVLALEIDEAPTEGHFELSIDYDHERPVLLVPWPALMEQLPEAERRYPLRHETRFSPPGELFSPAYLGAPAVLPRREDLDEIVGATQAIRDAAVRRDVDAYLDRMSLKIDEYQRAYSGWEGVSHAEHRDDIADMFSGETRCRPIEPEKLRLEPRAGGRVVHVTHAEGGHVIEVISPERPKRRLRTDLTFTRCNGQWRVFR